MKLVLKNNTKTAIYQQIVQEIEKQILSGELSPGEKLPTVRELAKRMDIANGTIKHAYDRLEGLGLIEMIQGKGTFVCQSPETTSRKEAALNAIDEMLDKLQELGFSSKDIGFFIKLKLNEREDPDYLIKILLIDCNPETLEMMEKQILTSTKVEIYKLSLNNFMRNPYTIGEEFSFVITTPTHVNLLERFVTDRTKLLPVVLTPSFRTISNLSKLSVTSPIVIVSKSYRFFEIVQNGCRKIYGQTVDIKSCLFGSLSRGKSTLDAAKVLILPGDYLKYCDANEQNIIKEFSKTKAIVMYEYGVDEGSLLYLKNKIEAEKPKTNLV